MPKMIGLNLRVTGHCNQGGRKYMEDAFVVAYQQTEDERDLEYAYFGIFDGHGGREAALYAKEHLLDFIVRQRNFWSDDDDLVLKAIKEGFISTHLGMWKEVGNWPKTMSGLPSTSGTTASVAFIRKGKMYIGHVGDSRIVLGYQSPDSDSWQPRPLTKDHKPETPSERERIYSVGGLVMNKAGVERVVWNRPRVGHQGPVRRSTHFDQIPFLAVARSLGDLWSYNYYQGEFIVSPEPDVCVINLDPKHDRCVILASDGLWNMVTPKDAVRFVQEVEKENEKIILESGQSAGGSKQIQNPSKLLVDRALNRWYNFKMRADNTSVVTVMLDPPGPPRSEVLLRQKFMKKLRPRDEQIENEAGSSEGDSQDSKPTRRSSSDEGKKVDGFDTARESSSTSNSSLTSPGGIKDKRKSANMFPEGRGTLPRPVVLTPKKVTVKRVSPTSSAVKSSHDGHGWHCHGKHPFPNCSRSCSSPGSCKCFWNADDSHSPDHSTKASDGAALQARPCLDNSNTKIGGVKQESVTDEAGDLEKNPTIHRTSQLCPRLHEDIRQLGDHSQSIQNSSSQDNSQTPSPVETDVRERPPRLDTPESSQLQENKRTVSPTGVAESTTVKRKSSSKSEDTEVMPPKLLRPHNRPSVWSGKVLTSCRVAAARDLTHAAKAKLRVRKTRV